MLYYSSYQEQMQTLEEKQNQRTHFLSTTNSHQIANTEFSLFSRLLNINKLISLIDYC